MSVVLVAVDFSDCTPRVVREGVRFAERFGARLLLLHAAEAPRGLSLGARIHSPAGDGTDRVVSVGDALTEDGRTHLAPLVDLARAAGVDAEGRVELGRVPDVILAVAEEAGAELIVVGTHARKGLLRAVLGSVAEEVVRRADVPVVTVRTRWHEGCTAPSCAVCAVQHTEVERAIAAEVEG